MIGRRIRARHADDDGVTLILVLIIITVVGLVMGAVLAYADTSLSTTVALRGQTGGTYGIDAAGNAYLAELRNDEVSCDDTGGTTSQLGSGTSPFYSPTRSSNAVNATIICTPDTQDGLVQRTIVTKSGHGVAINSANLPGYALLALRRNSQTEGITLTTSGAPVCVLNGNVASNGVISTTGTLGVHGGSCSGGGAALSVTAHGVNGLRGCSGTFTPIRCTAQAGLIGRPGQPDPSDPITQVDPPAVCATSGGTTYAAFQPGQYTDVALLNTPCSGVPADFEWFSPGTYYFDYGSTTWDWPATLVAGTPTSGPTTDNSDGSPNTPALTGIDPTSAASLAGLANVAPFQSGQPPASCADPAAQKDYPGVEFVFGGNSQVTSTGGTAEICATYNDSSTPTAIYGAPNAITVPGGSVSGQTLCTPAGAPTSCTGPLLDATGGQIYVNGYVYAPASAVTLVGTNGYLFNWGAALLTLDMTGSAPAGPTVRLPSPNAGFTTTTTTVTVMSYKYVDVWVCPASSTPCSTSGPPDLRVKVQYKDDGGKVTVLSWSAQP